MLSLDPAGVVTVAILCNDPSRFIFYDEFRPLVLSELAGSTDCIAFPIVQ
jgi:hypothetical protein